MTLRVLVIVVAPLTSKVPKMSVLPVSPATINLSVLTIIEPVILAFDDRLSVLIAAVPNVVVLVTLSVPRIVVFPDAPTTDKVGALFGPI